MPEKYASWIPRDEVARRLGLSVKSVARAVRVGKLRSAQRVTVGRRPLVVIHPDDVAAAEAEMQGKRPLPASKVDTTSKLFMSLSEAAEYTGLTETTLQSFMVSGTLAFLELDEGLRIRRRDLATL